MIESLRSILMQNREAEVVAAVLLRLIVAAILGGIVGLEREIKHKPAGLRTNMFICMGSAFFTVLSAHLASHFGGDPTRIAAQIIPGIGFIGAGSILRSRGNVTGLTTAATLFVVASIGMGVGGGQYAAAIFATILILVALYSLGRLETRFSLKSLNIVYQVAGADGEAVLARVNGILEEQRRIMQSVNVARANSHFRVQFTVEGTRREHAHLLQALRQAPDFDRVDALGERDPE